MEVADDRQYGETLLKQARAAQRLARKDTMGGRRDLLIVLEQVLAGKNRTDSAVLVVVALIVAAELEAVVNLMPETGAKVIELYECALAALSPTTNIPETAAPLELAASSITWPRKQALEASGKLSLAKSKAMFQIKMDIDRAIQARYDGRRLLELAAQEPEPEESCATPCSSGSKSWGGLSESDSKLVSAVADHGDQAWDQIAQEHFQGLATGVQLKQRWNAIAPSVKDKVGDGSNSMSCGHSCNSCPTRSSCQLHDALGDIEDMLPASRV